MKIPCTDIPLDLSSQRFVRIENPEHVQLQARQGTLWVTIDGEPNDFVVEAGESFEFASCAPAVVGALHGHAAATVRRRRDAASPRRRSAWRQWLQPRTSAA
jgi:hypothetical protein